MSEEPVTSVRPHNLTRRVRAVGGAGAIATAAATVAGHPVVGALVAAFFLTIASVVALPVLTACWIAVVNKDDDGAVKRINALSRMIAKLWTPPTE